MNDNLFSGSTQINDEGIKKHFKNIDPWRAIFELVWNGLDAGANKVEVSINENDIHSVESVSVLDDGDGIDFLDIDNNFGKFNDSVKKADISQHGSHGRGRLAFHRLSHRATWFTKSEECGQAKITVDDNNIRYWNGERLISNDDQHALLVSQDSGTCVELTGVHKNLPAIQVLRGYFSNEFCCFLAFNIRKAIVLNGEVIVVPRNEKHESECEVNDVVFNVTVIRWVSRPSSEKSYIYLINSDGKIVHRIHSAFNNKNDFYVSVFVKSEWADKFVARDGNLFEGNENTEKSEAWKGLNSWLAVFVGNIYKQFLRKFADEKVEQFIEEGVFPSYSGLDSAQADWRLNNTKELVRSIYIADPRLFSKLNKKQRSVIVRLLDKISVSSENSNLYDVLENILDLDEESIDMLADQLKRSSLESIIRSIEVLQQRQAAIFKLKELMEKHYRDVLETPDLQKIIEANTWIFGDRYETIGAEEDTFTKIAKSIRTQIKQIDDVDDIDVDGQEHVAGANRQTDLFLARKFLSHDSFGQKIFRCIVIEIKRPSVSLNKKHLRQLEDYAEIISKHAEFSSEKMHFELILIGRRISNVDTHIHSRLHSQAEKGEVGLVNKEPRMKQYVLSWATQLDGFELANDFMLKHLKMNRDSLSEHTKQKLVDELQKPIA